MVAVSDQGPSKEEPEFLQSYEGRGGGEPVLWAGVSWSSGESAISTIHKAYLRLASATKITDGEFFGGGMKGCGRYGRGEGVSETGTPTRARVHVQLGIGFWPGMVNAQPCLE